MVNLQTVSGLPIQFDNSNIVFVDVIECEGKSDVTIDQVKGELLNPELTCPSLFCSRYFRIDRSGLLKKRGLRYDIVVMQPNLAGIEYVKSKGHYNELVTSKDSFAEVVEVLYGWGTILLQRPKLKPSKKGSWSSVNNMFEFNKLEDVIVIKVSKGQKVVIPSGWGHVFINTRQTPFIFSIIRKKEDFQVRRFVPERGAGYYFIRKNARQEVVRNPHYKIVPTPKKGSSKYPLKELGITEKTPIFKQIIRRTDRFNWLTKPSLIDWNKIISAYIS